MTTIDRISFFSNLDDYDKRLMVLNVLKSTIICLTHISKKMPEYEVGVNCAHLWEQFSDLARTNNTQNFNKIACYGLAEDLNTKVIRLTGKPLDEFISSLVEKNQQHLMKDSPKSTLDDKESFKYLVKADASQTQALQKITLASIALALLGTGASLITPSIISAVTMIAGASVMTLSFGATLTIDHNSKDLQDSAVQSLSELLIEGKANKQSH